MRMLYNQWKFQIFCEYSGEELDDVNGMNYRRINSQYSTIVMSMMLTDLGVDHDVLFVSSRYSNTLDNVFTMGDFDMGIRINNNDVNPMYMFFESVTTHFNEIRFQGERAAVSHPKRHNVQLYSLADRLETELPVTSAEKNYQQETMHVSLLADNMQKLKVERTVKLSGALRNDAQKLLIPVQDVDSALMHLVNGETLEKRLSKVKKTKKMGDDYRFVFNKEREEMKKNFTTEIKNNLDQEPEQITDLKIIKPALDSSNAVFEYSATFVLNNLVKKAGNSFIVEAGKLTGLFLRLEDKDKKREQDVYMPAVRTFKYDINIAIPTGYSATGVDEFNVNKTNATGMFSSAAKVNGNTLTITVTQTYSHLFEKAADWPRLTELMQTASDFNDRKILLEKKG
jgi:hypothetical protein